MLARRPRWFRGLLHVRELRCPHPAALLPAELPTTGNSKQKRSSLVGTEQHFMACLADITRMRSFSVSVTFITGKAAAIP
jgi:hypothetical protein